MDNIEALKKKIKVCNIISIAALILIVVCIIAEYVIAQFAEDKGAVIDILNGIGYFCNVLPIVVMAPLFFRVNFKNKLSAELKKKKVRLMFYYYFDPTYILVLIGVLLSLAASYKVKSTFNRYSNVASRSGMSGAQAAETILHANGIYDVTIQRVSGSLTDHYDPRKKTLNLSESVYGSMSVAAIGVAAHECGHAIQHQKEYAPLQIRSSLVPVANFGSGASWFFIIAGLFLSWQPLVTTGIVLFSLAVLFQLVTLPVEFNASSRAVAALGNLGILGQEELGHTKKVLSAAALTYVASAAAAILQLLRLIILFGGRDRD